MHRARLLSVVVALGSAVAAACGANDASDAKTGGADGGGEPGADGGGSGAGYADGGDRGGGGATPPDGGVADAGGDGCPSTIAVVGGGTATAFATTWTRGSWTTASVTGTVASTPGLTALRGGFLGVALDAANAASWTASSSSTWWSPLTPLTGVSSRDGGVPLVAIGGVAHLIVRTADGKYVHGQYTTAWDTVTDPVGGADGGQSSGQTGVGVASIGGKLAVAHVGNDGNVYAQTLDGTWQKAVQVGAVAAKAVCPQVVALSGAADAMVLYVRDVDGKIAFTTRTGGAWSPAATIDATAYTKEAFSATALSGGRVLVAWHGVDTPKAPSYFSVYASGAWSKPAPLLVGNPITVGAPGLAPGVCGADALAVYIGEDAKVQLLRLTGATWSAPETVPETSDVLGVAVAAAP